MEYGIGLAPETGKNSQLGIEERDPPHYRCTDLLTVPSRRSAVVRAAVFVLLVWPYFFLLALIPEVTRLIANPLIHSDSVAPSQAIVVLTSGTYSQRQPDIQGVTRARKAFQLYENGLAPIIIALGGSRLPSDPKISVADSLGAELMRLGLPSESLIVSDDASGTFHDITSLLKQFESTLDFDSVMFVTSAYHSKRTKLILRKLNLHSKVIAAESLVGPYWHQRLLVLPLIVREYAAILYSRIAGYI